MYGVYLRAPAYVAFGVLMAALLNTIGTPLIEMMNADGTMLGRAATAVVSNFGLVALLSVLVLIVARAAVESKLGRGPI